MQAAPQSQGLHRKVTAVGTVGEMGQLMTVYERNWVCSDCNQENYASRGRCFRCKRAKPEGTQNYVMDAGLQALQAGNEIQWSEAIDPNTYQVYYYNKVTGATQWERPVELGPAPTATGWFGRGASGSNASKRYADLNAQFLSRPARKQKAFVDPKRSIHETGTDYNIWYGRFLSDYSNDNNGANKEPATDRCHLDTDAGFTRADNITAKAGPSSSQRKDRRFFCLHFAHGICAKGVDCIFYHRIPTPEDDARTDELFDCFGRSRHNKHRDDMNGVGSFMKPCRTLYVGNLLKSKYDSTNALEDTLWRQFSEWGELENCNVIHRLAIAFPRFRYRTSAEFAKEAMSNQALDHAEVLMIRWAYDDPNPIAQDSIARADKDAIASLLQSKGISLEQAPFAYPAEYQMPAAKRIKADGEADYDDPNLQTVVALHPELAYPNTDVQYHDPIPTHDMSHSYHDPNSSDHNHTSSSHESKTSAVHISSDWTEHVDPDTGATYYYNEATGESSWKPPAQ